MTFNMYTAEHTQRRFEVDIRQALNRSHAFEVGGRKKYAMQEKVRARQLSEQVELLGRWNRVLV